MAKVAGLGGTVSVDDGSASLKDISTDVTNWQLSVPLAIQEITGVNKSAIERLHLLADASIQLNGIFDPGSNLAHAVFKTVPAGLIRTVTIVAETTASTTFSAEMLFSDYQITRDDSGSLKWQAPAALADGTVPSFT